MNGTISYATEQRTQDRIGNRSPESSTSGTVRADVLLSLAEG